ncbi:TetR/AcrR family transcriptional regulator [Asanoa sp. WMMD1127]|uniref:TetR/AcrR family transcriptional regulator n=1 Tax=Asanoa sp. WMMD1127 TaxID=3016107 RepID=UPI002417E2AD|nr:TetR/AcrR family transcriptional regulator [Asanoa sp. WMMD1127]MDG4827363.1 TetR/AcrR family transcriptional regulator [Asanoa sp. WMMD1127]
MANEPLRDRLVRAGIEVLEQDGLAALTLREIARRAGVSHGAPRRYFPTHLELLSAIARTGYARLTAEVAVDPDGDPRDQLLALGRAYLSFARANPGMFGLMFRHDLLASGHLGLRDTALPLFAVLVDLIERAGTRSTAPAAVVAGALWANLHGIAQLWSWGSLQLAVGGDDPGALLRAAVDAHVA